MTMRRREFLRTTVGAAGATAVLGGGLRLRGAAPKAAADVIHLGPDRVRLVRLAIGTGTKGGSVQRQLGIQGLADMLHFGYDQGLFFWDTAASYQTHPHVREALKRVPREKVTILTKTWVRTAEQMHAELDRFRKELDTDYLDIVLLHAVRTATWPDERRGAMEALAEAHQKGLVRTYGVSCHSLEALEAAANTPWLRVVLARINFAGVNMDAEPPAVLPILRRMKAAGRGVIGMKILGEGVLSNRVDEALRFAWSQECVDCFTIGPANRDELADLIRRIPNASGAAKAA